MINDNKYYSYTKLKYHTKLKDFTDAYRPHKFQSISSIPNVIEDVFDSDLNRQKVVLLAIDGLSYLDASKYWSPSKLWPVTSMFPSTSSTCWTSAITGMNASEHGVLGVVYKDCKGNLINVYTCLLYTSPSPRDRG